MIFCIRFPIPTEDDRFYTMRFYFSSESQPIKEDIIRALSRKVHKINHAEFFLSDLKICIEQLESLDNNEFPLFFTNGGTVKTLVQTRLGESFLYIDAILPIKL